MIGETLGPYRIESLLGRGGMGAVYKALDPASGEHVAVKVFTRKGELEGRGAERFAQEAELLAGLGHPNLVAIRGGLAQQGDHAFYAMELVPGRSLAAVIAERGRLEPGAAVALTLRVLAGLGAAHARGVVHRDVKPSNVILARCGAVKVVDFGIARVLDATRLTVSGQVLGTPDYMSPEQADAKPLDARTDVYSAGVLLWELLAGKPPFAADSPLAVLRQHVEAPVPPLPVAAPPGLEAILRTALAKDPGRRFAGAGAFAAALATLPGLGRDDAVLAELAGAAETAALPVAATKTPSPAVTPPRRRRWPAIAAAAFLLVALAAGLGVRSWLAREPEGPVVRLETTDGETLEGRLIAMDAAAARVALPDGTERSVPRAKIRRLSYR